MSTNPLFDELDALAGALREGTVEDAQIARLDQLLADHPEALERFVDLALLRADLEFKLGRRSAASLNPVAVAPRRRGRRAGIIAAAAALLAVVAAFALGRREPATPALPYEGCAVLTRSLDAVWESAPSPGIGSVLPKGRLALASGWIEIEFYSGARVLLEGPADFELLSSNEGACAFGKLRAFVPPQAEGFAIRAAALRLVDRGTEFGLRIERGGDAEVHVFQGRVELHPRAYAPKHLGVGEAVRIDPAGAALAIPPDPRAFLTPSELVVRSAEGARGRFARWRAAADRLRQDPRLALHYSFEDHADWSRELRSHRTERSPLDGALIGCQWGEGRWPGKKALEFKGPGDRVRFRGPGSYSSITLAAWVRVDGIDRAFSGLMLTDGWTWGSVHWQITQRGVLRLGIHGEKQAYDYDTSVLFDPAQLGKWIHLCTVYDAEGRAVVHYVDGLPVRRHPLRFETILRVENAELGNWGAPLYGSTAIRNLNGRMDEFTLFGAALKPEEVRDLHQVGIP